MMMMIMMGGRLCPLIKKKLETDGNVFSGGLKYGKIKTTVLTLIDPD